MSDLNHQNAETGPPPMSDLTRRLIRRATEPIGVIDTRHAVELYARSTVLPAKRLALAKEFASRYGVEPIDSGSANNASTVGMPLVSPKQGAESPFELGSAPPWGSTTVPSESSKNLDFTVSSLPVQYRVRRPGSHAAAPSAPVASERAADVGIQPNTPMASPPVQKVMEAAQSLAGATLEAPARASISTIDVSRQATPIFSAALPRVSEMPRMDVAPQMPVPRQSRNSAIDPALVPAEDLPGDLHSAKDKSVPEVIESPRTAVAAHMPLARTAVVASPVADKAATQPMQESVPTSRALTSSDSPVSALQSRGRVDELPALDSRIANSSSSDQRPAGASPAALVAETQAPPSPAAFTSIVWRKAESPAAGGMSVPPQAASLGGPTYGTEAQMRQTASEPMATNTDSHVALTSSSNGGIDLTRVAEQVSRILTRQLRTSRERRGGTR